MIPHCPARLPDALVSPIDQFAEAWLQSPLRPRVEPEIERTWNELVEEWIRASILPLYIRKSAATRGKVVMHHSGRPLIPCDNTTAVWAYTLALEGECPSLPELPGLVREQAIPFAFTGLRGRFAQLYAAGRKLAHIDDVGLGTRERLENISHAGAGGSLPQAGAAREHVRHPEALGGARRSPRSDPSDPALLW